MSDLQYALDRISTALDASRLSGATADEDARCMSIIRAEIERLTAERDELIAALRATKRDARRYRDWLRGGANIPPESTRWARWEVRYWDGRHWNTLFAEALDTSIDAAMGLTQPAEES